MSRSAKKSEQIVKSNRNGEQAGITYAEQKKLSLNLRSLHFEVEVKKAGFPTDMREAVNRLIQVRAEMMEGRYEQVLLYVYMKQFGSFWLDFGCASLEQWLAMLDLPTGATLASREVMVRMFSKETFVLLGDDILGEMMYLISRKQPDMEQRKRDYQAIFDAYTKSYASFDKTKFREIINWYVNTNYTIPAGKNVEDVKARPPRELPVGVHTAKVARPVTRIVETEKREASQTLPTSSSPLEQKPRPTVETKTEIDFVIEERLCAGCQARDAHISSLEKLIRKGLGAERVPDRPRNIKR